MAINEPTGNTPDVRNVEPLFAVNPAGAPPQRQYRREERKQEKKEQKKVADFFHPLSKAVEASNRRLIERNLPYRFRVFKQWGEVFIELSVLDSGGKVIKKQRKNITQSDFNRIIDDVAQVEGLFFDHIV